MMKGWLPMVKDMKFKSKVSLLIRGIFLIFTAIVLQVIEIIAMLPEGKKGMIAIVFLTIFFSGLIAFSGLWDIREYLK